MEKVTCSQKLTNEDVLERTREKKALLNNSLPRKPSRLVIFSGKIAFFMISSKDI